MREPRATGSAVHWMWSGCSPWFGKPVNHMGIAAA